MDEHGSLRGARILLVEDDALLRDSLSIFFHIKGCTILAFPDAESALDALGEDPLDIVITDHLLPGMTGLALLQSVESTNPEAVRILITGHPGAELSAEAGRAGVDEFVRKPFTAEALEKTLAAHLGKRAGGGARGREPVESGLAE